uniref:MARVEL domain-containing protein n=1 Tax=Compsopogon caeruleus TaxID=31354 RepID=A0A7S1T4B4_9RHOD
MPRVQEDTGEFRKRGTRAGTIARAVLYGVQALASFAAMVTSGVQSFPNDVTVEPYVAVLLASILSFAFSSTMAILYSIHLVGDRKFLRCAAAWTVEVTIVVCLLLFLTASMSAGSYLCYIVTCGVYVATPLLASIEVGLYIPLLVLLILGEPYYFASPAQGERPSDDLEAPVERNSTFPSPGQPTSGVYL